MGAVRRLRVVISMATQEGTGSDALRINTGSTATSPPVRRSVMPMMVTSTYVMNPRVYLAIIQTDTSAVLSVRGAKAAAVARP